MASTFGGELPLADVRRPSVDELMAEGLPPGEASRLTVRQNSQEIVEAIFQRWERCIVCVMLTLPAGMFGVLIWSQTVYDEHWDDTCDMPLALMLPSVFAIGAIQVFDVSVTLMCYDSGHHGPIQPFRVYFFRRLSILAAICWSVAAAWMLGQTQSCSDKVMLAVKVILGCYGVLASMLVIVPVILLPVLLSLVRRGLVRAPRSANAAPDDLIERLPVVEYDPALFNDGTPGGHPTLCPICLDNFDAQQPISKTPCGATGHAFHTDCLKGWLQLARQCPLCRLDLSEASSCGSENMS